MIFRDFPGPGIFKKKNPGLSGRRGNPGTSDRKHCTRAGDARMSGKRKPGLVLALVSM